MPKYQIDIEGETHEWDRDSISVAELRELAGFADDQPLIEVDLKDNSERELAESEVIDLKPGRGFGKKVGFKRG